MVNAPFFLFLCGRHTQTTLPSLPFLPLPCLSVPQKKTCRQDRACNSGIKETWAWRFHIFGKRARENKQAIIVQIIFPLLFQVVIKKTTKK
ncbi:MAG: hypothetical protein CSA31_00700 [Desulfobulbus propionicus]|nr:MAG: hypothetical protein CSA31_00700 [Desulfobulbus propionicus]